MSDAATPISGTRYSKTRRVPPVTYSLVAVALFALAWEGFVRLGTLPQTVVPSVSDVLEEAVEQRSFLLPQVWVTVQEALLGFALSITVGVGLGVAIVTFRTIADGVYPILVASQVVPKIAIAPLFTLWFGFGMTPKILLAFVLGFFPVVLSTVLGLRSAPLETLQMAQSTGAGWFQMFTKIRLPAALPSMFVGVKLSATFCVTGAIVGEFISPSNGLGRTIVVAGANLQAALLFAGTLYIAVLGITVFALMNVVERLAVPWHVSQRRQR